MLKAMLTAATGMSAQELCIDAIANNLANVNTTGFKKSRVSFQDLFYQYYGFDRAKGQGEGESSYLIQVGNGTRVSSTNRDFSQGKIVQTGSPLDLMIEGRGFFPVLMPDGTLAYTRDGSFKIDGDGRIITPDGYLLYPDLVLPAEATGISISPDGKVSVTLVGESETEELGQIILAKFVNPGGLKSIGRNLYTPTLTSGEALLEEPTQEGLGQLSQGFLEASNVDVVDEMVAMILAQRAYEINSKVIQTSDNMLSLINRLSR
jgi:flagellar basal-body rod protein FlgG